MEFPSFLINSNNIYIVKTDVNGNIIYCNQRFIDTFPVSKNELKGRLMQDLVPAEQQPRFQHALKDCIEKHSNISADISLKSNDNEPIDIRWEFSSDSGKEITCIGYNINYAEEKESEIKYHSLFEQASDPIMITDFNGNFIDVNTCMCNMFGYSKAALLKMNINSLIDAEQLKSSPIRFDLLAVGQHIFSQRKMLHKNGKIIEAEANVKKIGENMVMAIARDVTELKKAEANLIAHEKQLNLFVEQSPAAIAMFDMDMRYLNVSQRWLNEYRLEGKQLIGRIHYEVFPWIPQHWRDVHKRGLAGVTEKCDEDSYTNEDGTIDWLRWEVHPWHKASGEIGGIIMLTEIITGRKNAELARLHEEETRQLIMNSALDAIICINTEGLITLWNPQAEKIFGWSEEEIVGKVLSDMIIPLQYRERHKKGIKHYLKTGQGPVLSKMIEMTALNRKGREFPIELSIIPLKQEGTQLFCAFIRDITERKQAAEENERIRYMLNERVKELTTLYRFGQVLQTEKTSMQELLQELVTVLPGGWQYHDIAAARIVFGKIESRTTNYAAGQHKQDVSFKTSDGTLVKLEVVYLEKRPHLHEGPFAAEERNLINMVAEMFRIYLARKDESEALKKSEANLHTIFDTTDTIYVLLDKKFKIISYNKPALHFAAKELGHRIQMSDKIADYFPKERRTVLMKQMKKALQGNHVNYEAVYPQADGSSNWYDVRILEISGIGGEVFGIILAVLDITEKKLLEAEILKQKIQEQKRISRAIIKAQERERNHIGQELHDNVNQILAGTKLYMKIAAQGNKTVEELIKYPLELIDSSIHEIRLLSSRQVTPLKDIRLKDLVSSLLENLEKNTKLKTDLAYDISKHSIDDDLKLNIYRIIQEQVNNITKYAEAKSVNVSVLADDNKINVSIADDGIGFNVNKKRKGIGISNMINRVEAFNGDLSIESAAGKGTKVQVTIPLEKTGPHK